MKTAHFVRKKTTLHFLKKKDEFRIVVKSVLLMPDTMLAKLPLSVLDVIRKETGAIKLHVPPFEHLYCSHAEVVVLNKEKRTMELIAENQKFFFHFTEEEWKEFEELLL